MPIDWSAVPSYRHLGRARHRSRRAAPGRRTISAACWQRLIRRGTASRARPRPRSRFARWASRSRSTPVKTAARSIASGRSTSFRGWSSRANGTSSRNGLTQRVNALNRFIDDVYHEQHILERQRRAARTDREVEGFPPRVHGRQSRRTACGRTSAAPIWCATPTARVYVLEDNLRVPSGVSYMLENREVMKRVFPELFEDYAIHPVDDYAGAAVVRTSAFVVAAPEQKSGGRRADPRHLQLGVLRARVPRAGDGLRARRGVRPGRRQGRLRLHAHDRRPDPRRRHLSAHRRSVPRSEGVPRRLDARRAAD